MCMRIKGFEIQEPVPELRDTQVIAMLEPWIDAGNVGSMTISWLEKEAGARPLAELEKPANFYDLTRYRPMLYFAGEDRRLRLPNTRISFARQNDGTDFVFLRLLEPHMLSDYYIDSVEGLLDAFNVKRYMLIGSMYNFVPHTRPPLVSGGASTESLRQELESYGVSTSRYEGPTSICSQISHSIQDRGGETVTMIVSLPQYTQLDDDYIGAVRLQRILSSIYGFTLPEEMIKQAEGQREQINEAVEENPQVKEIIHHLEHSFDSQVEEPEDEGESQGLSPQVEEFLREMERRFRKE
jgi:predicted ATP-grasp superfamily ATP-dependent carboligase